MFMFHERFDLNSQVISHGVVMHDWGHSVIVLWKSNLGFQCEVW